MQDIQKYVVDKGKSQIVGRQVRRDPLQSRRLQFRADRGSDPQRAEITGKKVVTGEDVRRGLETLNISAARWKELGLPDFGAPIERCHAPTITAIMPLTCSNGTAPSG